MRASGPSTRYNCRYVFVLLTAYIGFVYLMMEYIIYIRNATGLPTNTNNTNTTITNVGTSSNTNTPVMNRISILQDKNVYYALAVQDWCSDNNYRLHGLWVDYVLRNNGKQYPTYCRPVSFSLPTGELLYNMSRYWNNCVNDVNKLYSFWEHEWKKHGSCFNGQITEQAFFQLTLKLFLNFTQEYIRDICSKPYNINTRVGNMESSCIVAAYDDL